MPEPVPGPLFLASDAASNAASDDAPAATPSPAMPSPVLADPATPGPATGAEFGPAVPAHPDPLDRDSPAAPPAASGEKLWTVGTLTYTTGGLLTLFAVLLGGDFALSMRERSVPAMVQQMIKRLTPSDLTMVLLISTLPTILTLLILPVVSYKSDRHRGRWGRRIPYLLVPAPLAAGAMVLLAFSERYGVGLHHLLGGTADGGGGGGGGLSSKTLGLICFAGTWTVFECVALIATPVFGALVNDVVPRPVLGRFFGLFRAISLIAGIIWFYWVYQYAAVHYHTLLIVIAAIFGTGMVLMCLTVREGQYPPPAPEVGGQSVLRVYGRSFGDLGQAFGLGYYRLVFVAFTLAALTFQPVNLFSIPYSQSIGMSDATYGKLMGLTYFCSLTLAWPLGWLVDRAHTLRMSLLTMTLYAVAMLLAGVMIRGPVSFGVFFVLHGVLSGCYFTTSAPLGQVLFPRLNYARYASAAVIVQSVVMLGFGPLLGQSLNWSGHNYRLTFLVGGLLAAGALACLLVVYAHFNRLGGRANYVPPGETAEDLARGFEAVPRGH